MLMIVLMCLEMVSIVPAVRAADPNVDQRLQEQKRVIMRRIEQRQEKLAMDSLTAQAATATTRTLVTETLPAIMKEFQKEISGLREDVQNLLGKARPQLEKALAKAPPTYKLELELSYAKGKTLRMTGYAQEKFQFSGPITQDSTTFGSVQFEADLKEADGGRIMVQYSTTVEVSIPESKPSPQGPRQGAALPVPPGMRPVSYRFNTQGNVVLKPGEAKEITSYGESSLKLTLTPD
jgi:hypothetical protein